MPEIHLCGVNVPDYQGSPPVPGLLPSHCTLPTRAHILNSLSTGLGEQGSTSCGKRASGLRPPSLSLYLFLFLSLICHKTLEQGSPARCAALWGRYATLRRKQRSRRAKESMKKTENATNTQGNSPPFYILWSITLILQLTIAFQKISAIQICET